MRAFSNNENFESQNISITNNQNLMVNMSNPNEVGGCFGRQECGPSPINSNGEMCFSNPYEGLGAGGQMGSMNNELNQMQGEINQMNMNSGSLYGGDNASQGLGNPVQAEQAIAQLLQSLQGPNGSSGGDSNPLSSILGGGAGGGGNPLDSILGGGAGGGGNPLDSILGGGSSGGSNPLGSILGGGGSGGSGGDSGSTLQTVGKVAGIAAEVAAFC